MDYGRMLEYHIRNEAELTVGAVEVPPRDAHRFGVLACDNSERITDFLEKPRSLSTVRTRGDSVLGSMGIYVFNTETLFDVLEKDAAQRTEHDFGKSIIPAMLHSHRVYAYLFGRENRKDAGYWRDVGTIDSYYEANMDLASVDPPFNLYDTEWPIRTYHTQYPPAKTVFAGGDDGRRIGLVLDSIISNGCIISGGRVQNSVLSPGVRINSYAEVYDSVLMDCVEVGRHARIRRAIISKHVTIPPNMVIGFNPEEDRKRFAVSDTGIVVIPKGTVLPITPTRRRHNEKRLTATPFPLIAELLSSSQFTRTCA
jgi:glucose-1-phosphate adenylyltransferase